jgi:hypothetical protein
MGSSMPFPSFITKPKRLVFQFQAWCATQFNLFIVFTTGISSFYVNSKTSFAAGPAYRIFLIIMIYANIKITF